LKFIKKCCEITLFKCQKKEEKERKKKQQKFEKYQVVVTVNILRYFHQNSLFYNI